MCEVQCFSRRDTGSSVQTKHKLLISFYNQETVVDSCVQTCLDMSSMTGCECDWYMTTTRAVMLVISDEQSDNNVLTAFFSISHTSWPHATHRHTHVQGEPTITITRAGWANIHLHMYTKRVRQLSPTHIHGGPTFTQHVQGGPMPNIIHCKQLTTNTNTDIHTQGNENDNVSCYWPSSPHQMSSSSM